MSNHNSLPRAPISHFVPGYEDVGIHVVDYGGEGPPLLLCHCTGTLARIWDAVVMELQDAFRCVAIDTRGHGDSAKPDYPEAYTWRNSGEDLLAVIDTLHLSDGAIAAGHSAGAAHIAYAEMLRPGSFKRVALVDGIIGPRAAFEGENPLAAVARRRKTIFESREAAAARLGSKPPMSTWDPRVLDSYLDHGTLLLADGQLQLKCPGYIEAWMYEQGGACDVFERLEHLKFEALLVTGGDSYVQALVEEQAKRMPDAQVEVVTNASHFIPQEYPGRIRKLLQNFLRH